MAKKATPEPARLETKSFVRFGYEWQGNKVEAHIMGGQRYLIVPDNASKPPLSKTDNTIQQSLADRLAKGPRCSIVS